MDMVAPPVRLLVHLRFSLERGEAVSASLSAYLQSVEDECSEMVRDWWLAYRQGRLSAFYQSRSLNLYRKSLLMTLEAGLSGESILSTVRHMEEEFLHQAQIDMERFIRTLPVRSMFPLLFFMFPAYLLLFFGPLLSRLLHSL
jgi:hypothetical protein